MATQGTTTIDFGVGATDVATAVSEAGITGGQLVEAWILPAATASNTVDNHWVEDLHVVAGSVSAGVGFTIYAHCKTGFAHGQFNVGYVFN
jgi:hypothetical protein